MKLVNKVSSVQYGMFAITLAGFDKVSAHRFTCALEQDRQNSLANIEVEVTDTISKLDDDGQSAYKVRGKGESIKSIETYARTLKATIDLCLKAQERGGKNVKLSFKADKGMSFATNETGVNYKFTTPWLNEFDKANTTQAPALQTQSA